LLVLEVLEVPEVLVPKVDLARLVSSAAWMAKLLLVTISSNNPRKRT
ncbi:hypothetical protein PC114_g27859, partial [Phytophthora cactorum]